MASLSKGVESWVLMALIHKDLDDYDYRNALFLSERLFAIDNECADFRLLYAKCHYLLKDYHAANDLLKKCTTIPGRYLYARTCLELGNIKIATEDKLSWWQNGTNSLKQALSDYENLETNRPNWADDLTCVSTRSHMPSESSIHNLLGKLYCQIGAKCQSSYHFMQCLTKNRFKFSAYIQLCDMTPPASPSSASQQNTTTISPKNIFKAYTRHSTTPLKRSSVYTYLPSAPSTIPLSSSTATQQQQLKQNGHIFALSTTSTPAAVAETTAWSLVAAAFTNSDLLLSSSSSTVPAFPASVTVASSASASAAASSILCASPSSGTVPSSTSSSATTTPVLLSPTSPTTPTPSSPLLTQHDIITAIQSSYGSIPLSQLRQVAENYTRKNFEIPTEMDNDPPERDVIEKEKNEVVESMNDGQETMKDNHDPTTDMTHQLAVNLINDRDDLMDCDGNLDELKKLSRAPRVYRPSKHKKYEDGENYTMKTEDRMKRKRSFEKIPEIDRQQPTAFIDNYFIPWISPTMTTTTSRPTKRPNLGKTTSGANMTELQVISTKHTSDQTILDAMNKIVEILLIIAKAYYQHSQHYCYDTVITLQKLDDSQYDTPSVLCLMGRAYYHVSDFERANSFYERSFFIAPWYCQDTHLYSTCLLYLKKIDELSLLVNVIKENQAYLYEGYIATGNWKKSDKQQAKEWFQKAIDLDPDRSYGYGLLGYEELEHGNYLGAEDYFMKCKNVNNRSYLGWYGLAMTYHLMNKYSKAKSMAKKALEQHPRHPLLSAAMAKILFATKEYPEALQYVEASLAIDYNKSMIDLRNNINQKMTETSLPSF